MNEFGDVIDISDGLKRFSRNHRVWAFRNHEKTTLIFPSANKPEQILGLTRKFNTLNVNAETLSFKNGSPGISLSNAMFQAIFGLKETDDAIIERLRANNSWVMFPPPKPSKTDKVAADGLLAYYSEDKLLGLTEGQKERIQQISRKPLLAVSSVTNGKALFFMLPIEQSNTNGYLCLRATENPLNNVRDGIITISSNWRSTRTDSRSRGNLVLQCITMNDYDFEKLFCGRESSHNPTAKVTSPPFEVFGL